MDPEVSEESPLIEELDEEFDLLAQCFTQAEMRDALLLDGSTSIGYVRPPADIGRQTRQYVLDLMVDSTVAILKKTDSPTERTALLVRATSRIIRLQTDLMTSAQFLDLIYRRVPKDSFEPDSPPPQRKIILAVRSVQGVLADFLARIWNQTGGPNDPDDSNG